MVARVGAIALALPAAYEEDAWTGVRWRVRGRTFAHLLVAQEGYLSSYRMATGIAVPTMVLTFRSEGEEALALERAGHPFYKPPWSPTIMGHGARGWHQLGRGGRAGHRELPVLCATETGAAARPMNRAPAARPLPRGAEFRHDCG